MQINITMIVVAVALTTVAYALPYLHVCIFKRMTFPEYREYLCTRIITKQIFEGEIITYRSKHGFSDWHGLFLFWVMTVLALYLVLISRFSAIFITILVLETLLSSFTLRLYYNYYYSYIIVTDKSIYWYSVEDMLHLHFVRLDQVDNLLVRLTKSYTMVHAIINGKKYFGGRLFPDANDFYAAIGIDMPQPNYDHWK